VLLLLVLSLGGAGLRFWTVARSTHPNPFDCLATASTGWVTISADGTTIHSDWKDDEGHIDGMTGGIAALDDAGARKVALEWVAPLSRPGKNAGHTSKVNVFAMCDGVPRWWSGTSVGTVTLRSCLSIHPRTMLQCVRDVVMTPAAVSDSSAWELSKKVHAVAGRPLPEETDSPPFAIPHWRGPADGVE